LKGSENGQKEKSRKEEKSRQKEKGSQEESPYRLDGQRREAAQEALLEQPNLQDSSTSKIAAKLKRKTDAVKKKASRMGLRKAKSYLKKLGRA
jgi:hypothetical protein